MAPPAHRHQQHPPPQPSICSAETYLPLPLTPQTMVGFQTTPNIRLGWQYDRLTQMANFESRLFQELCSIPIVQTPVCSTNFQPFAFLTLNMVLMIKSGSTKSARSIIVFQQSWNSFYWVACTGYIGQKGSDKKLTIIVSTLRSIAKSRYTHPA